MARVGDVDGDGVDDLAIGANGDGPSAGYVQVRSGATGAMLRRFGTGSHGDGFGFVVAGGRDVDGDGVPDVVVGAPGENGPAGTVWTYSGRSGKVVSVLFGTVEGTWASAAEDEPPIEEVEARARAGHRSPPGLKTLVSFGCGLELLPDCDGDGLADVAVTRPARSYVDPKLEHSVAKKRFGVTPGMSVSGVPQRVEIYSPARRRRLVSIDHGPCAMRAGGVFGWAVVAPGDLDGDGRADLAVSCLETALHAYSSATGARLWSEKLRTWGHLHADGSTLGVVSDVDGDGIRDLCVGANEAWETDRGSARLVSSASGAVLAEWEPDEWREGVDVAPLDDVDGDGLVDVVLATRYEPKIEIRSGEDLRLLRRFSR